MEWLAAILSSPITDKAFSIVAASVLLYILHVDLGKLRDSVSEDIKTLTAALSALSTTTAELHQEIKTQSTHQTGRMQEIRIAIRDMYRLFGRRSSPEEREER